VAMYQYVRITVCGDVSVCSPCTPWIRSVYAVIIFVNVSVCQKYMLVAMCHYVLVTSSNMLRHTK